MKKLLILSLVLASCSSVDKNVEIIQADLKTVDKLTDPEIETTKFNIVKLISSDGKKALSDLYQERKYKASTDGVFASSLDICNDMEIKDGSDVYFIEAYRLTTDTVFKKLYYINENKIVGKFLIKN